MRILNIFWSFTVGGAESILCDIMNIHSQNNVIALVVVNNLYSLHLINKLNPQIKVLLINRKPNKYQILPFIKLYYFIFRYKPDIVHCHNYSLGKILPFYKKKVLTLHNNYEELSGRNNYKQIIAISESMRTILNNKNIHNVTRIYNGVDYRSILPKKKYNDEINIVCIGRLQTEIKGQHILIHAFKKIIKDFKAKLILIGKGNSEQNLKLLVENLNLNEFVSFTGEINRDNIYGSLNNYDISVIPSFTEGFGLVAVESMLAKVPLIISNIKPLIEVTNNGNLATIFNCGDSENLAIKLKELILMIRYKQNELTVHLDKAFKYAKENYNINNTSTAYLQLYNQINH